MRSILSNLSDAYSAVKQHLSNLTGAPEDLLHVHAGLVIFGVSAWLLRRRIARQFP